MRSRTERSSLTRRTRIQVLPPQMATVSDSLNGTCIMSATPMTSDELTSTTLRPRRGGAPNAKRQADWNNKNDTRRDGGPSSFPRSGKGAKGKGKNQKSRRI